MVAETVLARAKGQAEHAEVFFREMETTTISLRAGELKQVGINHSRGVGLRVFAGGRVGFASTTDFTRVDELVDAAVATARLGRKVDYELPCGHGDYAPVTSYDRRVAEFPSEEMVALGEEAAEKIKAADTNYLGRVELERSAGRTRVLNTAGLERDEETTSYSFIVTIQRAYEEDILFHYAYDVSPRRDFDEMELVARVLDELRWADKLVAVKSGRTNLIFVPAEVPTLLLPVMVCVNGAYIADRSSALAGRLGEKVASEALTIVDDGTYAAGVLASSFDGEGTPTARTPLIENGVLTSYLTDLAAAATLNVAATGNARRTFKTPPHPGPSNVIVEAGSRTLEELLHEVREGLLVLQTAGGAMGNVRGGELSATVGYALKVEKGEVVGRVKDCIFGGNVFEMLGPRLAAVARTSERAAGNYFSPAIIVADQMITARE